MVDIAGRSHRQRLGQVIAFLRQQRGHDHRMVSRVCAMPIRDVEAMERGEHVPTFEQWSKLKRAVNRGLHEYGDLYRLACEERDAELAAEQSPPASRVGTNLGAKLQTALAAAPPPTPQPETEPVTEKPKPDTTKLRAALAALPDGWKSRDQIERRKAYALEQLRLRPGIRTSGADSLDTLLQRTFGVGLSDAVVRELRAQVERERQEAERERIRAEVLAESPSPAPPPAPPSVPEPPPPPAVREVSEDDLAAAVELILAAVPGLETFTITVDADGHASVDYQIRKVVVTTAGGSLKIPRRG